MSARPPIGLGDLVTALRVLGINDDVTRDDVTRVLGLKRELPAIESSRSAPTPPEAAPPVDSLETRTETLAAQAAEQATYVATDLVPLPPAPTSSLQLGRRLAVTSTTGEIDVEPLFDPRWSRSLVASIAYTEAAAGPIDVE